MQFLALAVILFSLTALPQRLAASPLTPSVDVGAGTLANSQGVCPGGLYATPQCCSTDVLGTLLLDCASPFPSPKNANDFRKICATGGRQAKCCVLPLAGQAVLCQSA